MRVGGETSMFRPVLLVADNLLRGISLQGSDEPMLRPCSRALGMAVSRKFDVRVFEGHWSAGNGVNRGALEEVEGFT